jgi:hypothetical protein
LEVQVIVAELVRNFVVSVPNGEEEDVQPYLTTSVKLEIIHWTSASAKGVLYGAGNLDTLGVLAY